MGSWNDTLWGLRVKREDQSLARQFLECFGIDLSKELIEEIGPLSDAFDPRIYGVVRPYSGPAFEIDEAMQDRFVDYLNKMAGYGDEYDDEDDEEEIEEDEADYQLDDVYHLASHLFSKVYFYLAHEQGSNTSDYYFRYEVIYDPIKDQKSEWTCYYDYDNGINTDTDDPKKEGTEKEEKTIQPRNLNKALIEELVQWADSKGYNDLLKALNEVDAS